jgi:glutamine amidotransferase
MLTYLPPNTQPNADALANGAALNDDGHGFAIVAEGRIIVEHSMTGWALVEEFARVRACYPDGPALFHSRFATHGTLGLSNCHPFFVGGDECTVVAHNGVLPKKVRPKKGDYRCDTRVAAEDFLPQHAFGSWGTVKGRARLSRWLGGTNKLVILTVDRRYREQSYVLNEKLGVWDEGIWYSNQDYRESIPVPANARPWLDTGADPYGTCPVCQSEYAMDADGYCVVCGSCADCGEDIEFCFCYVPHGQDRMTSNTPADSTGTRSAAPSISGPVAEQYESAHATAGTSRTGPVCQMYPREAITPMPRVTP